MPTFDLGPLSIQVWGLFVALGMLVALLISIGRAKRLKGSNKDKVTSENLYDLFIIVFIFGIIGARVVYSLEHFDKFFGEGGGIMELINISKGGLSLYGGLILAIIAALIYIKLKKQHFWQAADIIAPGFALGIGIARIGDYLMGNHIGERTKFFLGTYYEGDLRHSPSLYSAIIGFLIFIVLILLWPFIKNKEGVTAYFFIILYAASRFLVDFTRSSDIIGVSDPRFYNLTLSQWISAGLFVIFVPLLVLKLKKK
jgi:phosphatidylglycerol:prolipoprotein diacylglycerol transferase